MTSAGPVVSPIDDRGPMFYLSHARTSAVGVDEVWDVVRAFDQGHRLIRAAVGCSLLGDGEVRVGCVRRLTFASGAVVDERLVELDDARRSLAYEFVGPPPFEVRAFRAEVAVSEPRKHAAVEVEVVWRCSFEASREAGSRAVAGLDRLFAGMLRELEAVAGSAGRLRGLAQPTSPR